MNNDPIINDVIKAFIQYGQQQWIEGMKEAEDTCYCRNCGERSKSSGEVRQEERDEVCLYVCTACNQIADETPF